MRNVKADLKAQKLQLLKDLAKISQGRGPVPRDMFEAYETIQQNSNVLTAPTTSSGAFGLGATMAEHPFMMDNPFADSHDPFRRDRDPHRIGAFRALIRDRARDMGVTR